ncbi:hypothetical protein M0804_011374 [Polistes exclamans]|nr:hypothetical protein M0804_011374 [Polistes exclamans]
MLLLLLLVHSTKKHRCEEASPHNQSNTDAAAAAAGFKGIVEINEDRIRRSEDESEGPGDASNGASSWQRCTSPHLT